MATSTTPPAEYASWASEAFGGAGAASSGFTDDFDSDGRVNLLEFVFLSDPTRPEGGPFHIRRSGAAELQFHFPWNWRNTGFSWRIRHGGDLSQIATWPAIDPGALQVTRRGDIDEIVVTPTEVLPTTGYFVLEIVPATSQWFLGETILPILAWRHGGDRGRRCVRRTSERDLHLGG